MSVFVYKYLFVWVYEQQIVLVCVHDSSVCVPLNDTSGAICHSAGSTSAGSQGTNCFLNQYMIHEQLSIMNAAVSLILLTEPLLSKYCP